MTRKASIALACLVAGVSLPGAAQARPGDLDPSFSDDGLVRAHFGKKSWANALAIQDDGKILVAGGSDDDLAVSRYRPDGQLDASFSSNGRLKSDFGGEDQAEGIAIQADGRVVVAGTTERAGPPYSSSVIVARYLPDGSPDPSFSDDGRLTTSFRDDDRASDVAIGPDGGILVTGTGDWVRGALLRFQPDGTPDASFAGGGVADLGPNTIASGVAVQSDGKVIVGGRSGWDYTDFLVARFDPDGDPDPGFSGDGRATADIADVDAAWDIAVRPNGKIIATGTECGPYGDFHPSCGAAVARFKSDGSLDGSFGTQGTESLYGSDGAGVALTPDGGIVSAGETPTDPYYEEDADFAVLRLDSRGTPDNAFRGDGLWATDFLSGYDAAADVALQRNGRIVTAGRSDRELALARYRVDAGPADADADGIRDGSDRCPHRFGRHRSGCPHYKRFLTMEFHKHRDLYWGALKSREPECMEGQQVRVLRKRRGADLLVDTATTDYKGRWRVDARLHPGHYYGVAVPSFDPASGRCLRAYAHGFEI